MNDGTYIWSADIVRTLRRGRERWHGEFTARSAGSKIVMAFMYGNPTTRRYRSQAKAEAAASRWLDRRERNRTAGRYALP